MTKSSDVGGAYNPRGHFPSSSNPCHPWSGMMCLSALKKCAAMQHLIERTSVLEARMSAVEKMQDAVEQRVEVLDDSEPSHFLRGGREDTLRERLAAVESRVMTVEHQVKETTLAVRDPNEGFPHTPSTSGYLTGSVAGVAGASGTELLPQRIENMHLRSEPQCKFVIKCVYFPFIFIQPSCS